MRRPNASSIWCRRIAILTNAVSHELRTPLARFKFSLEILARTPDGARKQDYIDNMKGDVAEPESLIDEMLSYARLSAHNLLMNLVEIDVRHWLQRELAVYANENVRVACRFAIQPSMSDCRSSLNPDLMARAIHNIIRNGLRYAKHIINVHAQLNEESICICDDGPGIPPEMHARIFEPFSRLETSRAKASGGYGLGLAIAARILQRHQGRISVTNSEPCGVCFVMEWPRKRQAAPSSSWSRCCAGIASPAISRRDCGRYAARNPAAPRSPRRRRTAGTASSAPRLSPLRDLSRIRY